LLRAAVIGAGGWGKNHVKTCKKLLDDGKLASLIVCDADETTAKARSDEHGIPFTTDFQELLTAEKIDVASIATPSKTHYAIAKQLLNAGKDVLVEKPLAMASEQAWELVELAEKQGRTVAVGHEFRYHPAVVDLKARLDKGELGGIRSIITNRLVYKLPRRDMGAIHALAVHEMDLYCHLMGVEYPHTITAHNQSTVLDGIEETTWVHMEFEAGATGVAFESWLWPGADKVRNLTVVGTRASARIDYMVHDHYELFKIGFKGEGADIELRDDGKEVVSFENRPPLAEEWLDFLNCAENGGTPLADARSGARAVEMIEAAFESADGGKTVQFKR